jgi:hypothetical protein
MQHFIASVIIKFSVIIKSYRNKLFIIASDQLHLKKSNKLFKGFAKIPY